VVTEIGCGRRGMQWGKIVGFCEQDTKFFEFLKVCRSDTQEIQRLLRKMKVNFRGHHSPPVDPTLLLTEFCPQTPNLSASVQTGPTAHPASYTMGTGSFSGVQRSGRDVDHPPQSSAEVKERV
jgi:hypothetical protein